MNKITLTISNMAKSLRDLDKIDQTSTQIFGVASVANHKQSHTHRVAQLSIPTNGSIYMLVEDKMFIVPRGNAIFIPSMAVHAIEKINDKTIINNIYFNNTYENLLPKVTTCFPLSNLSHLIINKICSFKYEDFSSDRVQNLLAVLFDEFKDNVEESYYLLIPQDTTLYKVYQLFVNSIDSYPSLEDCAKYVHLSSRTLLRLFKAELKTSFVVWKQQFLFIKALALLEQEKSTSKVAYKLGYNSDSAFISMFKKMSGGVSPAKYIRRSEPT